MSYITAVIRSCLGLLWLITSDALRGGFRRARTLIISISAHLVLSQTTKLPHLVSPSMSSNWWGSFWQLPRCHGTFWSQAALQQLGLVLRTEVAWYLGGCAVMLGKHCPSQACTAYEVQRCADRWLLSCYCHWGHSVDSPTSTKIFTGRLHAGLTTQVVIGRDGSTAGQAAKSLLFSRSLSNML